MSEPIARTVKDFCRAYGIGKTLAYELIAEGRIVAVRAGRRTLILEASAKEWVSTLKSTYAYTHGQDADMGGLARKERTTAEAQK